MTALKKYAIVLLSVLVLRSFGQPDSVEWKFKAVQTKYNSSKSKSERTATPTIVKLTRQELMDAVTISDLIANIPAGCSVYSGLFTIKGPTGSTEAPNSGNTINIAIKNRFTDCQWIIIENLKSSCPKAHKANYKVIIY